MARQTTKRAPSADRILDAALSLAAQKSWRSITMEEIADEAGATLAQVRTAFPSKTAMLSGFIRRTDARILEAHDPADAAEPVRERLLDVLLRRLDMLKPHKAAVRSIVRDTSCDPASLVCVARRCCPRCRGVSKRRAQAHRDLSGECAPKPWAQSTCRRSVSG